MSTAPVGDCRYPTTALGGVTAHERAGGGLGTSIVEALSHQLNARTEVSAGPQGTIVSIIHVA